MTAANSTTDEQLIAAALRQARDTRLLVVEAGVRHRAGSVFANQFPAASAIVVADCNTFSAAGKDVCENFRHSGVTTVEPFIFEPHVYADDRCVVELQARLSAIDAIPVAVGSGTINDLTKLAAHRLNRPYMAVATAASMDGYTAYGASVTARGSKQTFDCPAPQAVLADLETIAAAPREMNAAGYADLIAKVAAGADWIVADALQIEPILPAVWQTVQDRLHAWLDAPGAIALGEPDALRRLVYGLMMTGFAMQAALSSRPASGAEHQFSHLWDMQHHEHQGSAPSHGFKVGIGTLASIALYEELLKRDLSSLDIEAAVRNGPSLENLHERVAAVLGSDELAEKAKEETAAKYVSAAALREQLELLRSSWPELRDKLLRQLLPLTQVKTMLREAGCPIEPKQIGISKARLRQSYEQALFIRRRFTVLDLAHRTGLLGECLGKIFGHGGQLN